MTTANIDAQYEMRQPIREDITKYLASVPYAPNFLKLAYDLAPNFGVDPNRYGSEEHKRFQNLAELALNDLIDIEKSVIVLPPLDKSSSTANILNRFGIASFS